MPLRLGWGHFLVVTKYFALVYRTLTVPHRLCQLCAHSGCQSHSTVVQISPLPNFIAPCAASLQGVRKGGETRVRREVGGGVKGAPTWSKVGPTWSRCTSCGAHTNQRIFKLIFVLDTKKPGFAVSLVCVWGTVRWVRSPGPHLVTWSPGHLVLNIKVR